MNRRLRWPVVALALVLIGGASVAYAQEALLADIPFKFMAGGKAYEPGKYEVRLSEDQMGVTLTPTKGAAGVVLAVTRLAEPSAPTTGHLVFDKLGEVYYLSEVWMAGEEGIVLHTTKQKHTHHKIPLTKK